MGSREALGLVQLRALRVFHGFSRFRTPTAARCSSPSSIRAEIFMDERPGDPFEAAMHLFSREKCPRTGGNTVSHREKASSASGKRRFRWENRFSAKERALSQLENVFFQSTKHVAGAPSAFRAWKRHFFGENGPSPARNGRFQAGKTSFRASTCPFQRPGLGLASKSGLEVGVDGGTGEVVGVHGIEGVISLGFYVHQIGATSNLN